MAGGAQAGAASLPTELPAAAGRRLCRGWAVWAGQARAEPGAGASPRTHLPGASLAQCYLGCPGAAGLQHQLTAPQGGSLLIRCYRLCRLCISPLIQPFC